MKAFVYHMQVNVRDAAVSLPFYRDLLHYLEFQCVHDDPRVAGYSDGRTSIWLIETDGGHTAPGFHRKRTGLNHVAFRVPRREDVDRFTKTSSPRADSPPSTRRRASSPSTAPATTPSSSRTPTGSSSRSSTSPSPPRRAVTDLNGGHLVARTLKQAGVGHLFTLCGGHILPIYDGCLTEGVAVVDMRHEQACAHAGDAYARLTRNIGVAVVTAGPGVTDAVTGVANAYSARSPLLLIGGAAPLGLRGLGALQETEQVALLRPITKGSWTVAETRQIPEVLTTAIRTALTGRPGPVFVEIPVDLLMTVIEDRLAPIPSAYVHRSAALADPADVDRLAQLIARAERPLVMAGSGVYWDAAARIARALRGGRRASPSS